MSERRSKSTKSRSHYGKHREHVKKERDEVEKCARERSRSPHAAIKAENPENAPAELTNISLDAKKRLKSVGIQMKLASPVKNAPKPQQKLTIASVFNQDSDDEPEEMPPEAKMRMRNIGRDTPTSSGPNSFGKTKQGFSDAKKLFEKNLKESLDD